MTDLSALLAQAQRQAARLSGEDGVPKKFVGFCDWLGVELTPGQRAFCRVAYDGEPVDDEARAIVGAAEPSGKMSVVAAVCGGRAGKSYVLIALRMVWGCLVRDLRSLAPGQKAVALVVAPNDTLRQEVINYALGAMRSKPELKAMLRLPKGSKDDDTPSSFVIARPDGEFVSFEGGVATRGGYGGRGRSLTDFAMDECAFFRDASYKVNDIEIFRAASPRVLPGGQTIIASTPWAEAGLLYEFWRDNWQNPKTALVAHAPTLVLRPSAKEMVDRERLRDPDNAKREFDAQFMATGSNAFFEPTAISAAIVPESADPFVAQPGDILAAGLDAGFRSDSSALAICARHGDVYNIVEVVEKRPDGAPLKPSETISSFAATMTAHGVKYACGDGHYRESVREHLDAHKLEYVAAPPIPATTYMRVRALFREGKVRLPNNPRLLQQLREVEGRPLPGGGMSIMHPRWSSGGHGDIAEAVVLALYQVAGTEVKAGVEPGTPEWEEAERDKRAKAARAKSVAKGREWWRK